MSIFSKPPPLVITLKIDEATQKFFDAERKKYFPAYCNYVDAHITLFHKLPSNKKEIDSIIEKFSKKNAFELNISDVVLQDNGVAYEIECAELLQIHKEMQEDLSIFLIRNDRKKLSPHITI